MRRFAFLRGEYVMNASFKSWINLTTVMLAIFVAAGCGHVQIQTYSPQPIDQYQHKLQKDGFKIVVDPFKENARLETYFGCDLLAMGVYPLFVMIENHNPEDGFVLVGDQVRLVKTVASPTPATNLQNPADLTLREKTINEQAAAANVLTTVSPLVIPLLPVAVIFAQSSASQLRDDVMIRRNMEDKQLPTKALYHGGSLNGFLYFRIDKKEEVNNAQGVVLSMKNLRTNELKSFAVPFN
jgi:hypothetical protein